MAVAALDPGRVHRSPAAGPADEVPLVADHAVSVVVAAHEGAVEAVHGVGAVGVGAGVVGAVELKTAESNIRLHWEENQKIDTNG